jgi:hypothetical protein
VQKLLRSNAGLDTGGWVDLLAFVVNRELTRLQGGGLSAWQGGMAAFNLQRCGEAVASQILLAADCCWAGLLHGCVNKVLLLAWICYYGTAGCQCVLPSLWR